MSINFQSLFHSIGPFFNHHILPSLTSQQKKILIVASIAFGFLAAYCVLTHYCFHPGRVKNPQDNSDDSNKDVQEIFQEAHHPEEKEDVKPHEVKMDPTEGIDSPLMSETKIIAPELDVEIVQEKKELFEQKPLFTDIPLYLRHASAYYYLASSLSVGERILLANGKEITKQELYLMVIQLDPTHAHAYNDLGETLRDGESIALLNGRIMTQQELYLEAIQLNPSEFCFVAYANLAQTLSKGESIRLLDGRVMDVQELNEASIR